MEEKNTVVNETKKIQWGLWIASFFLPVFGYIMYLVKKEENPNKSNSCGWGALFGSLFYVVMFFVWILFIQHLF